MKLKKIELPIDVNFEQAKALAQTAAAAINAHQFGYVVIIATRAKAKIVGQP